MKGTHLSKQDKENVFTLRWLLNYLRKNSKDLTCRNYAEDGYDLVSDILDEDDSHVDSMQNDSNFKLTRDELDTSNRKYVKDPVDGKVAIVIGHNMNTGAVAHDGSDEWTTRKLVAEELQDFLGLCGVESRIFIRNGSLSYGNAMREHGRNINNWGADVAIELHFNSAGSSATGTEFICCSSSGRALAETLVKSWKIFYPEMVLRRDEGVYYKTSGRGVGFCRATKAPAVVYEPFFASNSEDWVKFKGLAKKEASALGNGIVEYLKSNK